MSMSLKLNFQLINNVSWYLQKQPFPFLSNTTSILITSIIFLLGYWSKSKVIFIFYMEDTR